MLISLFKRFIFLTLLVMGCSSMLFATQLKLTASDGQSFDHFGWSVAVSGDTIVISADTDNDSA